MVSVYNRHTSDDTPADLVRGEERPTETQRIYHALKRAILAGTYRPGEALQEIRLAVEFGASRTPVREAFQRLEADGLLTISPRRGAFVQQPTVRDFLDINELRLLLEPVAARMASGIINEAIVRELQNDLMAIAAEQPTEDDFKALEALDLRLHLTIADTIDNVRMAKIIRGLNDMMQIVRERDMRRRHRELHASIGEILAALLDRDDERVESEMRRHIGDFSGALRTLV
jgi:DNA-binding GntR family transcriptional regulator